MTGVLPNAEDLAKGFRAAADAALEAEHRFRASWRERLEALERERTLAFLRFNLVADLLRIAGEAADAPTAQAACLGHVATAFRLDRGSAAHAEIFERLGPVVTTFVCIVHPMPMPVARDDDGAVVTAASQAAVVTPLPADAPHVVDAPAPPDAATALAGFEAWYAERYGAAFLARADLPMPETPLVDW